MTEPRDRLSPSFSFRPKRRQEPPAQQPRDARKAPSPSPSPAPPPAQPPATTPFGNLRQWAGSPKATLAVVFTDIVASTALGNKIGNRAMDVLRRGHFEHVGRLAATHDGFVVKTMGDSVMVTFHAASDALDFALAVHADPGDRRLRVRVGVHVGPVTVEEQDVHGATVNYAARVVAVPGNNGVWLSSEAKGHVDQEGATHQVALPWQTHSGLDLKGFVGKQILWSIGLR